MWPIFFACPRSWDITLPTSDFEFQVRDVIKDQKLMLQTLELLPDAGKMIKEVTLPNIVDRIEFINPIVNRGEPEIPELGVLSESPHDDQHKILAKLPRVESLRICGLDIPRSNDSTFEWNPTKRDGIKGIAVPPTVRHIYIEDVWCPDRVSDAAAAGINENILHTLRLSHCGPALQPRTLRTFGTLHMRTSYVQSVTKWFISECKGVKTLRIDVTHADKAYMHAFMLFRTLGENLPQLKVFDFRFAYRCPSMGRQFPSAWPELAPSIKVMRVSLMCFTVAFFDTKPKHNICFELLFDPTAAIEFIEDRAWLEHSDVGTLEQRAERYSDRTRYISSRTERLNGAISLLKWIKEWLEEATALGIEAREMVVLEREQDDIGIDEAWFRTPAEEDGFLDGLEAIYAELRVRVSDARRTNESSEAESE